MSVSLMQDAADLDRSDQIALRLMLTYVESECLRIGATDAARHAALAAALMPSRGAEPRHQVTPLGSNRLGRPLH